MSEPTPYWPPPPTTPIPSNDLTPTHTELQTLRTFHAQHEIDVLLDASFAADYRPCAACGAMIGAQEQEGICYPCSQGNRARGPIYGASLAGHTPVPGDALRAVEAVWLTPASACAECARRNGRIDALLEQNDAQAAENSDLARQVVSLKGHLEELTAQVRQGKLGGGGLGDATT